MPALSLATIVCLTLIAGCDRGAPDTADASPACQGPQGVPLSLQETYDRLRDLRARRSYVAMRPHVDPEFRDEVIDLLIAMDELLAANAGAQSALQKTCPDVDARMFDMSPMTNRLELLSRDVELVGLHEEPDSAKITLQIADRARPQQAQFERRDGRWLYMPGPGAKELTLVARNITLSLNRIALVVSEGPMTRDQIESEYRLRVCRKLKQINVEN